VASGADPFVLGSLADLAGIFLAFIVIPACLLVAARRAARRRTRRPPRHVRQERAGRARIMTR